MNRSFLPAEWHPQSGVQLTWPHKDTDWNYILEEAEECFATIASAISARELCVIVTPYPNEVKRRIERSVTMKNIRFCETLTNDTWARDHGGITMLDGKTPRILDFCFNGWGLKFAANHDNLITRSIHSAGLFSKECTHENRLNFVIEGGSVESDGRGTMLTTSECLLSLNRNGEWLKEEIESYLKKAFALKQILWLDHGYLAGDDTDSHIDTLARLAPDDTIIYVKCTDTKDEHYEALLKMESQLKTFRTLEGKPYTLIPLPMADAVFADGERLPATYANFLIINGAVLLPIYNQPANDEAAKNAIAKAFPLHEIVSIDCSVLIRQHGSLHCVTMQYPEGVF